VNRTLSRTIACLTTLGLVAVTAACGGDDGSEPEEAEETAPVGEFRDVAAEYIGVTPGQVDDSLAPIRIGWVNNDRGDTGVPAYSAVTRAAVQFLNEELGGIDGHRVEIVECPTGTNDEEAQACAQQFVNDPSLLAYMVGFMGVGFDAFQEVAAGRATIYGVSPTSPAVAAAEGQFWFSGGAAYLLDSISRYLGEHLGAESVALLLPESPAVDALTAGTAAAADDAGIELTTASYPVGSTDLSSAIVASGASDADALLAITPTTSASIALARSLQQLGVPEKPSLVIGPWTSDDVSEALGDLPRWTANSGGAMPQLGEPEDEIGLYEAAMSAYEPDASIDEPSVSLVFGMWMTLAKMVHETGADTITTEALADATSAFRGPMFLGPPEIRFGEEPFTAVGTGDSLYATYEGDGEWTDEVGWLAPTG
jgi:branched-chain amino acid transport system substrate-binding protein